MSSQRYIVYFTMFIHHTCKFLSFYLYVFKEKNFLYSFYFCWKFGYLDQFYSFTCTIHLYRFYHNVYPSPVLFFKFLLVVFLQEKIFCTVFILLFCWKFGYLNQFYSSARATHLYRFYPLQVLFFKFLPIVFLQEKFLYTFNFLWK